ncbi:MAG: hypothetical protein ONA69_06020, partial [candidate division KSB1 bacterium]|nr:hypothetical protein [candidate division KSB1 bacterium]
PPWILHEKRCFRYLIWYLRSIKKVDINDLEVTIKSYALEKQIEIPYDVIEYIRNLKSNFANKKTQIINVEPKSEEIKIIGQVISKNLEVNFLKRMKYSDNAFGRGFLGKLLDSSFMETKIRVETRNEKIFHEYKFFLDWKLYNEEPFYENSIIFARIVPQDIPGRNKVWICSEFHKII